MKIILQITLILLLLNGCTSVSDTKWTIIDETDGLIYPSAVLSFANMDEKLLQSEKKSNEIGEAKGWIDLKLIAPSSNSKIKIVIKESSLWRQSTSVYELPTEGVAYTVTPKIIWNYDALRNQKQPTPIEVIVSVEIDGSDLGEQSKTYSIRSINECVYGLYSENQLMDLGFLFAAYVNEDHPVLQQILKEGLQSGLTNSYHGYQGTKSDVYDQIASLWNALQLRGIKYSSITESSQTSNIVFSQRVRTIEDALNYGQANCVDGTVLFASLLRAIGIDPILVKIPGHMFLGFYMDKAHTEFDFLETTMLGSTGDIANTEFAGYAGLESYFSFISANERARQEYDEAKDKEGFLLIDVDQARQFVKPIGL